MLDLKRAIFGIISILKSQEMHDLETAKKLYKNTFLTQKIKPPKFKTLNIKNAAIAPKIPEQSPIGLEIRTLSSKRGP